MSRSPTRHVPSSPPPAENTRPDERGHAPAIRTYLGEWASVPTSRTLYHQPSVELLAEVGEAAAPLAVVKYLDLDLGIELGHTASVSRRATSRRTLRQQRTVGSEGRSVRVRPAPLVLLVYVRLLGSLGLPLLTVLVVTCGTASS
jgi:hypothetical protein